MKTRQDYLDGKCNHDEYYRQFVTRSAYDMVMRRIGRARLLASTDPHFNDIPLKEWDHIGEWIKSSDLQATMKRCGDGLSLAGLVCIAKQAARMVCTEERPTL